jgi:hypothetical protein
LGLWNINDGLWITQSPKWLLAKLCTIENKNRVAPLGRKTGQNKIEKIKLQTEEKMGEMGRQTGN